MIFNSFVKNNSNSNFMMKNYYKNSLKKLYDEINQSVMDFSKIVEDIKKRKLKILFGDKITDE